MADASSESSEEHFADAYLAADSEGPAAAQQAAADEEAELDLASESSSQPYAALLLAAGTGSRPGTSGSGQMWHSSLAMPPRAPPRKEMQGQSQGLPEFAMPVHPGKLRSLMGANDGGVAASAALRANVKSRERPHGASGGRSARGKEEWQLPGAAGLQVCRSAGGW